MKQPVQCAISVWEMRTHLIAPLYQSFPQQPNAIPYPLQKKQPICLPHEHNGGCTLHMLQ